MGNAAKRAPGRAPWMALILMGAAGLAVAGPMEEWDRVLRERIESRLLGQVSVDTRDISVQVDEGDVRLAGTVESLRDAESIERMVRGFVEVRGVDNRIAVRSIERTGIAIQQEVRLLLDRYPTLRWPHVAVSVDEGVVVLSGRVQEAVDRTVATIETSSVPGVLGIQNLLEIEATGAGRAIASQVYSLLRNPLTFGKVGDLRVEAEGGTIRLLGRVWREADRVQAERLAATVEGVERINNLIEVDLPGSPVVQGGDSTVQ